MVLSAVYIATKKYTQKDEGHFVPPSVRMSGKSEEAAHMRDTVYLSEIKVFVISAE